MAGPTPNPFWVAVIVIVVAFLLMLLFQMAAHQRVVKTPAEPRGWYSIAGQQEYTGYRASDAVLAGPYNPDLAFFPFDNSSCMTKLKNWREAQFKPSL